MKEKEGNELDSVRTVSNRSACGEGERRVAVERPLKSFHDVRHERYILGDPTRKKIYFVSWTVCFFTASWKRARTYVPRLIAVA